MMETEKPGCQRPDEPGLGEPDTLERKLCHLDVDCPVLFDFHRLVVRGQEGGPVPALESDVHLGRLRQHQRPHVEVVRGDRGDDEHLRIGHADRTAGAEGIGGGSGAGGDDETVGPVGGQRFAVHADADAQHGRALAVNGHLVDGVRQHADALAGAGALERSVQDRQVFDAEIPFHQGLQDGLGAVFTQEADAAEVHAQDGKADVGDQVRGAQERAVAAHRQDQVRLREDVALGADLIDLVGSFRMK